MRTIVGTRCSMCHAAEPLWPGLGHAPDDVMLETPAEIVHYAPLIERWAVRSSAMPPGNVTQLEPSERETLSRWLAAGQGGYHGGKGL